MNQITIIGLGLIGGSFGLALNKKGKIPQVVGYDANMDSVRLAVSKGAVHWGTGTLKLAVEHADLIILAIPVGQMKEMVEKILPFLKDASVIFDVGSTKEKLLAEISRLLPPNISFVGGHPMAGSEQSGISAAHPYLFENAIYVITPQEGTDPDIVESLVELLASLGAKPKIMSPGEHDQTVAGVSHLPYIVAVSLVNTVQEISQNLPDAPLLAAGGFRDTTRVAGGSAVMWRDIALSNQANIIDMINRLQKQLEITKGYLAEGAGERLEALFTQARENRKEIPITKGVLPEVYELFITVPDQPGMLSFITGSLGKEGVNIAEIEVLRVRENQEGAIRLAFQRKDDLEKSIKILMEKGISVTARS